MAKRIHTVIDGQSTVLPAETRLDQILPTSVRSLTTLQGELIPRERFSQVPIPAGFDTNLSEYNRGAPSREDLLNWEMQNIARWLNSFEAPRFGRRSVKLHKGKVLFVYGMPLPDHYSIDQIDVLLAVENFPSMPPIGLYAVNGAQRVVNQLNGQFNAFPDRAYHNAQSIPGYTWICYHYAENKWQYNAANPARADNIAKFLHNFYSAA